MSNILYLQEVTKWDDGQNVPNHIYMVDNKKGWLIGYIKKGTNEEVIFKSPYKTFSKKNRNFKDVTKLMGW